MTDPRRLAPGDSLDGRYTLLESAGSGPAWSRWLADDAVLGRRVVVMCVTAEGPAGLAALDAARRAAGVDEPRLVRVLDAGQSHDLAFVVEEPLDQARSLTEVLTERPLPAEETRRVIGEIASTLAVAGGRGLHHLALTPDSIWLTEEGAVKVRGLATEAALLGRDETTEQPARADASAVLRLAYAALTGHWPASDTDPRPEVSGPEHEVSGPQHDVSGPEHESAAGVDPAPTHPDGPPATLPAAPTEDGHPVPPSALVPGVSQEFDDLVAPVTRPVESAAPAALHPADSPAAIAARLRPWTPMPLVDYRPSTPTAAPTAAPIGDPVELPGPASEPSVSGDLLVPTEAMHVQVTETAGSGGSIEHAGGVVGHAVEPAERGEPAVAEAPLPDAPPAAPLIDPSLAPQLTDVASAAPLSDPAAYRPVTQAPAAPAAPAPTAMPGAVSAASPVHAAAATPAPSATPTPQPERTQTDARLSEVLVATDAPLEPPAPLMPGQVRDPGRPDPRVALGLVALLVIAFAVLGVWGLPRLSGIDLTASGGKKTATVSATGTGTGTPPSTAGAGTLTPVAILQGASFEPDGDGQVTSRSAASAWDGNPATAWRSNKWYGSEDFGGLNRQGYGLIADLGQITPVRRVTVTLPAVQDIVVYVANQAGLDQAIKIGESAGKSGELVFTVPPTTPANGQLVIVMVTKLGPDGPGKFRAMVSELQVAK